MSHFRRLLDKAACADADPDLFDATTLHFAQPALAYCATCPVTRECLQELNPPQTFYTGVAGGKVWGGSGFKVKEVTK